jgi:hypothetical protein
MRDCKLDRVSALTHGVSNKTHSAPVADVLRLRR